MQHRPLGGCLAFCMTGVKAVSQQGKAKVCHMFPRIPSKNGTTSGGSNLANSSHYHKHGNRSVSLYSSTAHAQFATMF